MGRHRAGMRFGLGAAGQRDDSDKWDVDDLVRAVDVHTKRFAEIRRIQLSKSRMPCWR